MNLNHLKFAREVANTGSFTEAAKICCVTQPTLSNGIVQLEDNFGGKLFERTTRKVNLTPFGQHMLPVMLQMLDAQQEIQQAAEQFLNPEDKKLTIGFSPLADMRIIKAIVDLYTTKKTAHSILFKECFMENLYAQLEEEKIALAVCPGLGEKIDTFNFSSFIFYLEPVFVLKKGNGENKPDTRNIKFVDELENEVFVLTSDLCGHAPATRNWFKQRGKKLTEYSGSAISYQVMQEWANLGIASAILPWSKISDINRLQVSQLFLEENTPAMLEFKLIWKTNSRYVKDIAYFLDHCKAHITSIIACLDLSNEKFQTATTMETS